MKNREEIIFEIINNNAESGISFILEELIKKTGVSVSKPTVNRDLEKLLEKKSIKRIGKGPTARYIISDSYKLFKQFDVVAYFEKEFDFRNANTVFNFDILPIINKSEVFFDVELNELEKLNNNFQKNISSLPPDIVRKEFERLTIELSWKSSKIEGNTYDLLETENLIKENHESIMRTHKEAVMILNHKKVLDYIRDNKEEYKDISVSKIENLHSMLIEDLGISENIRNKKVGITGTRYTPLDIEYKIREALQITCEIVNNKKDIYSKAMLLNILIAYIQPFNDGNKRTSRLMGNAILMANDSCPLSFRSIDVLEYKKAMLLFYEQNSLDYFKKLFVEQFEFAVGTYFL